METTRNAHEAQIIRIPSMKDCRGMLCVAEHESGELPFTPRRTFWITGVPEGQERGYHAHRTCWELLFAVHGNVTVDITDAEGLRSFLLSRPDEGLLIPPMCWCRLHSFSKDAACICLASEPYCEEGYIHDIEHFKNSL
ncbi:MAG: FdtA/QdtA family cupin domain-containing protein [Alloprevotella sp.]|nr:FdtA/QdtA family cupin domain-containing protein [Alloprevotella sp.]MBR1652765.1 FdtA/QdtA family cupin domain-containing protein [Alloprevotella sp.]